MDSLLTRLFFQLREVGKVDPSPVQQQDEKEEKTGLLIHGLVLAQEGACIHGRLHGYSIEFL